jgi:hypothetical protein
MSLNGNQRLIDYSSEGGRRGRGKGQMINSLSHPQEMIPNNFKMRGRWEESRRRRRKRKREEWARDEITSTRRRMVYLPITRLMISLAKVIWTPD